MEGPRRQLWFYEKLYGRLPFLSTAEPTEATILILLLFEVIALVSVILMEVPLFSILIGTLMIFMLALWTEVASYIAPNIRAVSLPKNEPERRVMKRYKELLFSEQNVELVLAFLIFGALLIYYIYTDWRYFLHWVGKSSLVMLLFGLFITWEVSYRVALSLWTSVLAAFRSLSLFKISRSSKVPASRYFPYKDIQRLERLDRLNLSFALIAVPLYLVSLFDPFLNTIIILYIASLFLLYAVSAVSFKFIETLPESINGLLTQSSIGLLGLFDTDSNSPHLTPIAFTHDPFNIYIVTSVVSKKLKILKKNPKACFLVDLKDEKGALRQEAVMIKGEAQVLDFLESVRIGFKMLRIRRMFKDKYPQYVEMYKKEEDKLPLAWQLKPFVSRLVVKLSIDKMIYWDKSRQIWIRL
jgi:nitroimidazol reductase NimA-like FMN-containing flavoprotein (pyridoxamine 5'-phosphate oxidase superfamily)